MRVFGAVAILGGTLGIMMGCSGALSRSMSGAVDGAAASGLVLTDSDTQTRYSLSVADGAPALTQISGTTTVADGTVATGTELLDGVTGQYYSLRLTGGAMTLGPGDSQAAVAEIGLTDTVTARTYELAVASGSLTLTAKDEGTQ